VRPSARRECPSALRCVDSDVRRGDVRVPARSVRHRQTRNCRSRSTAMTTPRWPPSAASTTSIRRRSIIGGEPAITQTHGADSEPICKSVSIVALSCLVLCACRTLRTNTQADVEASELPAVGRRFNTDGPPDTGN
jgi:hypothetical protein